MRDKIYISGLTLVIISFLACVISFYLVIFCVPVFLIGTGFIVASKKTFKKKLVSVLLPLILYLPLTVLFLFIDSYTPPKTILIPSNYNGILRIIYEQKCGAILTKENGKQLLRFPENGILILRSNFENTINNEYYLVDESGNRKKITEILFVEDMKDKQSAIMLCGSGILGTTDKSGKEIKYSDFYLFKTGAANFRDDKTSQKFDSLTTAIVSACQTDK